MKKSLILFTTCLLSITLTAQIKGKMHFNSMGQERVFNIYSADAGYRYEFNENGQEGVIIVKQGSPEIVVLMPQQKMAMKGPVSNPMSMGNDPVASYNHFLDQGTLKAEGEEIVNGIKCTRSGLWNKENPNQKMFTIWTSDKYNFPLKLINHIDGSPDGSTMELTDLEPWAPAADSFEIPDGYQLMDMPNMMP